MVVTISVLTPFVASAAGITQIAFTSAPQMIEPSTASGRITLEAEDAAGEAVRGSTVCIQVTSSSASGEFSTNAESWSAEPVKKLSLTISSNQYRRNFYYHDSAEGTFTITAHAALRPSGSTCSEWKGSPMWSTSQQITVDTNAAAIAAAHEAELAAASAPKTAPKAVTPTSKKKTTKFVSKGVSDGEDTATAATKETGDKSSAPTGDSEIAAPGIFSDSLWWVATLGLVGAGCFAIVLSRKSVKKEWNIVEETGD